MLGGIVLSIVFARPLGVYISQMFNATDYFIGKLISFIMIFIFCSLTGFLMAIVVHRMITFVNLGFLNRLLGGCLGLFQGMALAGVILTAIYLIPSSKPWIDDSFLSKRIVYGATIVAKTLPDDWMDYILPERWIGVSRENILNVLQDNKETTSEEDTEKTNAEQNN
jgi:uncharacterized membrane protein required for colicin V production